ncbi:hypothetical protein GUJ93_ZPchr0014g46950 [Zizania palustris]|uniref:Uncharacterized protein n=1 Tax=Zizania palustris TaxID=103762 RepID=A0A8J5W6U7_ZIZPA|nr:hypothetical protein GUJ93_ZPchr0014g46950 [Zizania palustris]
MQVLADLQQAIASLLPYLGLAPMASTLPNFPYGVTGFLTTPSPLSLHAEAEVQGERKDQEALNPILIKEAAVQQGDVALVESPRADTPVTPDEESHNGSLDSTALSFHDSTNGDVVDPAPQPLPPSADDDGADPEEEGDYVGSSNEGQEGEDDDKDAMLGCGGEIDDKDVILPVAAVVPDEMGGPAKGLKTARSVGVGRKFPAQGGAADRHGQHVVFFLDSSGMVACPNNGEYDVVDLVALHLLATGVALDEVSGPTKGQSRARSTPSLPAAPAQDTAKAHRASLQPYLRSSPPTRACPPRAPSSSATAATRPALHAHLVPPQPRRGVPASTRTRCRCNYWLARQSLSVLHAESA